MEASLLGRLPPELRNRIYEALLPAPAQITVNLCRRDKQAPRDDEHKHIRALARTCKGVYLESMGMYCGIHAWTLVIKLFYLGYGDLAMSPPHPRPRALVEMKEWLDAIGHDTVRCIRDLNIIFHGGLSFLETSETDQIRPAAAWLANSVQDIKSILGNVNTRIELQLPLGRRLADDGHFKTVTMRIGDLQDAYEQVDRHVADADIEREESNKLMDPRSRHSPYQLAILAARHGGLGNRCKWFLGEIAA